MAASSSSSSQNVELEAAKFLQKLIQESKDEPSKLATKLFVILQHMKSSGKEHSMPYQVISRAMETVINQHGLDIEALKSSRLPLSGPQVGDSSTLKQSDSLPAAALHTKLGVGELQEMSKSSNPFASCKALVGPSSVSHEYYQGSGSLTNRSNQSFDQESPSSVDTRSANSQSQERRDAANYGKSGSQKDSRKTEPKRKRGDPSVASEPHVGNPQKGEPDNNTRKGKMNKVDTVGPAVRGVEQTNFNIVQSAGPMEHLPSSLLSRVKQDDQMQRVASYDSRGLVSKMHEQRTMDTYGIASTPLEQHSLNRGATDVSSTRGDDASVMLASESSVEHDRGRLSMTTNEGRNPAVAESGALRHPNMRDTGKSIVSRASAVPGTPFKEQQLKQLRAQCLVFLAFRNEMPPKPSHLEIALGNILQEGTNMGGLRQEPLDQKGTVQPSKEPSKVPDSVMLFGRLNIGRETDRIPAGFSAGGSISSAHLPATEAKDPRLLENRSRVPSNLTMPPEEMKGLVGSHGLEVHVQNQTAEPQAYPSAIMDVAVNRLSNLGKDYLQVLKANLASSSIMNQKMKAEIGNQTGFGVSGEVPGGSMVSSTLRDNWKPVSGSNSEHQVVTGMDSHIVTARDAVHDKPAEENVEDGSASVALPPPKYTMLDKWVMGQQKNRLMVEQNQLLKQHRAEQKIAACFDGLKKNVSSSEDISAKTKSVIELKKLQLLALQRRLRSDFLEDFFKPAATGMEHLRSFKKHRHGRRVKQIEKYEQKMKEERFKRIRERQKEFFSDIEVHKERLEEVFKVKRERLKGFNKYVKELHKRKERIHREKIDRIQREKITLLKINDVEGYLRMVQDAKSDRVKQLLKETEKYLQKLGSKLKEAKSAASRFEHDGDEMQTATDLDNIDTVIENEDESDQAKHYKESNEKYYLMAHSVKESISEQPAMLHVGKLREYQMNGLRWLVSLYNNHLNGILADEMGLGKTVQVISLICYLMETKNDRGPFLVVVPSSVLPGWENEINFWAPAIHKIVYAGPPEERRRLFKEKIVQQKFNVLLTTYEYMMNKHDRPKLSKVHWHYIIIDEGHRIKNASCKLNADLKHYQSSHRLLLTGTPLQNSLEELWALLNFLLPNIFNSSEDFSQWFNKPFQSNGDSSVEEALLSEEENLLIINRLHQVLRPFVLRRLKHKVENELPAKIERLIRCEASAYQKLLMKRVEDNLGSLGNPKARSVQNSVMELRNICNHPYISQLHSEEIDNLIPKHYLPPIIRLCGKLEMLDRLLPKLKATDHRVLFFSTMTRLLDVMEEYLNLKHYRYLRLDGHTSGGDRGALIDQFNNPNSPYFIFLLSIRAGGVGVNLQAADTVILFDTDWNPQVDLQAQARAHRIGQKKDVLVLRFETVQTVEEQVRAAAEHKLGVANQSITAGFFDNNTSAEDRREYLESLLRECKKEEAAPVLDDDTLNDVIARRESEIEIFESIDRQRREEEMAAWTKLVTGQGKDATKLFPPLPSRLVTDDDLKAFCEAMKIFETPKVMVASTVGVKRKSGFVDTQQYGRGKRMREVRSYEEQMTEEEFEKMCQVESPDSPGREGEGVKTQLLTKATIGSSESAASIHPTSPTAVAPPVPKIEEAAPMPQIAEATPMPQIAEATPMPQKVEATPMPQTAEATPMPQISQVTPPAKRGRGRPKRVVSSTSAIQPPSGTHKMKIEPQVATHGVSIFPSPTVKGSIEISTDQVAEMKTAPEAIPPLAPPAVDSQSPVLTQERGRRRKTNRAEVLKESSSVASLSSGSQSVSVAPPFLSQKKGQIQNIPSRAEASQGITPATLDSIPNSQLSPAVVPASIGSQTSSVEPPLLAQEKSPVPAQEQPPVLAKEEPSIVLQEQPPPLMPEKGQRRKTQIQTEAPRRRGRKRKSEFETGSDGMAGQDSKLNEQLQKQSANPVGVQASSGGVSAHSCATVPAVNPCPETPDAVIRGKEEEASQGLIDENRERVCGLSVQEPKSGGSDSLSKGKQPASSKIGSNVRYVASMMKELLSASKTKVGERPEGEVRDSPSLPVDNSISSEVTGEKNPEERTLSVNSAVETAHVTRSAGSQEVQSGGGVAASAGRNERRTRRTTRNMAKKFTEESLQEMPALPPGFETLKKADFSESGIADATIQPPSNIANSVTMNQTVITPHSGILALNLTSEGGKEPIKAASCILDQSVNATTDDSKTESSNTVGPAESVTESEKMPNDNLITESEREALEADVQSVEFNKVKHEDHTVVVECHVEETTLKQDSSDEPFKEKLSDTCVNTITNPEGDTTKKCQQELDTKGADIGEVLHSKDCSSELQAPPSNHVLDELPVKTDLSEDKGAANSLSEVAELGGSKEEMSDQICDSHTSVSFSNYTEPLPSSPAVEEKMEASHGFNIDDSLALQEAAQVEIAQQSDGLNLYLDYLAAAEEKTKDSEGGGVDGQVGISEVNPETADEACEVKNEPISAADSAVIKESECFLSGDDSLEKTNLETIRDDEAEMEEKMAPTHDSPASTDPEAAVFRYDSLDEIKAETARSDYASVEDQVNAIPDMVTERTHDTVLQGFDLGCDSAKPETAQPDDAVQDTQENERSDRVTDDAAVSGFDFGSDHDVNLEIASTDNEPQEKAGPHEITEKVHHTTLPRFNSGSDQVIQDAPTTDAIQESQGNAVPDLVPKESHQSTLPGIYSGSDQVEAEEAAPTDRTTEEPQEIARMEQVPEKPHHTALQEVDLGCEVVQRETCQDDPAMKELHGNAHPDQVAEKVDLTVSPGVISGCDLVKSDNPADHTIEEPQENTDSEVPGEAHHSELTVVDLGSDHVEQQTSPIDHANAGLDEVPHVDHHTFLSGMDSGHEQVLADTCPPDDTLKEPLQRASSDQVPEKIHQDVLPAVCLESDPVNAEIAPTSSTVEVLPGVYSGPDQDKSETTPTNHVIKQPQGNSGPDQAPAILEELDSGSNQEKPETCPTSHAIVQVAIGNTCPDQGPKSDIPEVSDSTKEPPALLDNSTDVEMDSVVLGSDAQDEVKRETSPTNDAVKEPQETAVPFQVTEEAQDIILAVDGLESDSSKLCEPEEQIAEPDAAVAEQLNIAILGDGQKDEVCLTTSNSQIEPETSVSGFSEKVEQLVVPEDFDVTGESRWDSLDEAKVGSVTEAYETVQQQSSPTHDSTVAGESKSFAGVSEIPEEQQSIPVDDSTIAGESKPDGKVSEIPEEQRQSVPVDDSTIAEESLNPVGEVSEIPEEEHQSIPVDDSTIAEDSLKPVGEVSETLEQQSVPADHSTITEVSLKSVGEVSETLGQQRIAADDFTIAGEHKPIGEDSETLEQLSIPADDSSNAGESLKPVDKASETLEWQSVPADDSACAEESMPVAGISETLEQDPLPETDDSAGAGESEPVVEASEALQQEPIPEADDSAGAGESEPVVEASETLQQEPIPEADYSAGAGESKPVAEVSETLAQESLQEVDDSAGAGELKPIAEVSVTLEQEPFQEADDSEGAGELGPVEISETLQREPLPEADDSAGAGELGPVVEVSEILQHEPLLEADDSAAAGESM